MKLVYQITGAERGQTGDCFQACLATLLNRRLNDVPNFMAGTKNGEVLSLSNIKLMNNWLRAHGNSDAYFEMGFNTGLREMLDQMENQLPESYYILTGCTREYATHSVICKGGVILHDPATSPGHTVLVRSCRDGYFRVGVLLRLTI